MGFIKSIEQKPEAGYQVILLGIFMIISAIIAVFGFFKLFRAYNHILDRALDLKKWQEKVIASACFIVQIIYTYLLFWN